MAQRVMRLAMGAALMAGWAGTAVGQVMPAQGQQVSTFVALGQKQVPLPPGAWTVAAAGTNSVNSDAIGPFGAIQNLFLFRIQGNEVDAIAEINANAVPVDDGWGAAKDCARKDIYLALTRYKSGWDGSCLFVKRTLSLVTDQSPVAWGEAVRYAQQRGLRLPPFWITAGMRVSDRQDIVDARFHLNPDTRGLSTQPPADGRSAWWSIADVKDDPRKFRYLGEVSVWVSTFDSFVTKGLHNQFAAADARSVPPLPYSSMPASEQPLVDAKLLTLERLYQAGLLTPANYRAQEKEALSDPLLVPKESSVPLAVQKNISFRVFGSAVDYLLAFAVTLSAPVSAYITATIVGVHSVVFVLNDNFWEDYFAKRGLRGGARTVDFAYAGVDAPDAVAK